MTRSTLTAADYKYRAEDLLGLDHADNDLEDDTVKIAIDEYMRFYRSIEVLGMASYGEKEVSLTMPTAGADLGTLIPTAYDYKTGFKVYYKTVYKWNRLLEVPQGSFRIGYYIQGDKIYPNNITSSVDLKIVYQSQADRVDLTDALAAITPDIDANFEDVVVLYIKFKYYIRNGDSDDAAFEARDDSRTLTMERFSLKRRPTSIAS